MNSFEDHWFEWCVFSQQDSCIMLLITDERAGKVRHLQDTPMIPMSSSGLLYLNEKTLKGYVLSCFFLNRLLISGVDDYWCIYILIVELTLEHISMSIAKMISLAILQYDVLRQYRVDRFCMKIEWSSNLKSVVPRRIPLIAGELSSQPGGAVLVVWRSLSAIQDCWERTHRRQQDTGVESEKYWQHGKVWDENNQPVTSDRMMIININEFMDTNGWFLSLLNERSLRVPESPAHQQAKTIFCWEKLTHCKRATEAWGVTTDSWVDVKVARSAQDPQLQAVRHAIWQRLILGRWFSSCHMLAHCKIMATIFLEGGIQ